MFKKKAPPTAQPKQKLPDAAKTQTQHDNDGYKALLLDRSKNESRSKKKDFPIVQQQNFPQQEDEEKEEESAVPRYLDDLVAKLSQGDEYDKPSSEM